MRMSDRSANGEYRNREGARPETPLDCSHSRSPRPLHQVLMYFPIGHTARKRPINWPIQ